MSQSSQNILPLVHTLFHRQARAVATAEARSRAERERAAAVEAARERERLTTEKVQDELRRCVNLRHDWQTTLQMFHAGISVVEYSMET